MRTLTVILAAALATTAFVGTASARTIERVTCSNCAEPADEARALAETWNDLVAMGTTAFLGTTRDGVELDEGAMLSMAREVGSTELDRILRSGGLDGLVDAARAGAGADLANVVNALTGGAGLGGASGVSPASMVTTALGGGSSDVGAAVASAVGTAPGQGGAAGCSTNVSDAQQEVAEEYVTNVQEASLSAESGFSSAAGSAEDASSGGSIFKSSCLDMFMSGDLDMLFRPPDLQQLVGRMTQALGGGGGATGGPGGGAGGGGACGAPSIAEQVRGSFPRQAFNVPGPGFQPHLTGNRGNGDAMGAVVSGSSSPVPISNLTGMFR